MGQSYHSNSISSKQESYAILLREIIFLCKFISNYTQIVNPLQGMIKKDEIYKWDKREKDVFAYIKQAITKAPTLYSPYFSKDFLLYTFTFDTSLAVVLM